MNIKPENIGKAVGVIIVCCIAYLALIGTIKLTMLMLGM